MNGWSVLYFLSFTSWSLTAPLTPHEFAHRPVRSSRLASFSLFCLRCQLFTLLPSFCRPATSPFVGRSCLWQCACFPPTKCRTSGWRRFRRLLPQSPTSARLVYPLRSSRDNSSHVSAGGLPALALDALNERMKDDPDGDVKHMCEVALSS